MKRTFLTLSVIVAFAFTMYGQGRVFFNNESTFNPADAITLPYTSQEPGYGIGYPEYAVQLLWVPGTILDQWTFDAAHPTASAVFSGAGVFAAPTGPTSTGAGFFDAGVVQIGPPGTYTMQVLAWYRVGYPTYDDAFGLAATGRSALFTIPATASPTPANSTVFPGFMVGGCLSYPPSIIGQPQSQSVYVGSNATFTVSASSYPYYQWRKNGSPIAGATQPSYTITGVTTNDAGNYDVTVINCAGRATSAIAVLEVLPLPPIPVTPPSQTAELATTASFYADLPGDGPEICQWFFNRTNRISDATNSVLLLENVQFNQAGVYSVVFTDAHGAVTSAPAMLNVIAPVERRWVPGLRLAGQPGNALNLEATESLVPSPNWAAFDSLLLTNASQWYFNLNTPLTAQRYFRAWQAGVQVAPPALDAHLIPALTLTGAIGSNVRVDGINQFGPTDAWFPLATVTLTNTSQLYFDVSVIGQPPRLWRLVASP
jgi:hypothetical protein